MALQSATSRHPFVQAIQRNARTDSTIVWTPGHCGINGNEIADRLAALGRRGVRYTKNTPGEDIRKWAERCFQQVWVERWNRSTNEALRKIKDDVAPWNDRKHWREQVILSRLRAGHTRATHYMDRTEGFHRMCSTCDMRVTVEHIICVCPEYEGPRRAYGISQSIREALCNDPVSETTVLLFLKDSNLYDVI